MDEMVLMYQRMHARAHEHAIATREAWDYDDLLTKLHQQDQARAFLQSWLWRYGNLMDLEEC